MHLRHRQLSASAVALATLTALVLGLTGPTPSAQATATARATGPTSLACDGVWRVRDAGLSGLTIHDLTALDAKHAWAVGSVRGASDSEVGVIAFWDGSSWHHTTLPQLDFAWQVRATSPDDIWVAGTTPGGNGHDVVLHNDGKSWHTSFSATQLGPYGTLNTLVARAANDVWLFGSTIDNNANSAVAAAHFDGRRWALVPQSLARSADSVVLTAGLSPSGEIWLAGEDIADGYQRTGYLGVVRGGRPQRVALPQATGQVSTLPEALTWDAAGDLVVTGFAGNDVIAGTVYPFSAVRHGSRWTIGSAPTPVAGFTDLPAVARIGDQVWSAGSAQISGREWTTLDRLGSAGWSAPAQLAQLQDSRPIAMAGLPSGQGWLVTWDDEADTPTEHVWTVCVLPGSATAAAGSQQPAPAPGGGVIGPVAARLEAVTPGTTYHAAATCSKPAAHQMRCLAEVLSPVGAARARATSVPIGFSAPDFRAAYGLPSSGGNGRTVAVVAAFGYPRLASDLATYRKASGLPACTTASGCLRIVDEHGGTTHPAADTGWDFEQALDVQAISAVCPDCHLLVVQADSPFDSDLAAANQTAARLGAAVVNNSFGQGESVDDPDAAVGFVPAGVTLVAAAGDVGLTASFPSTVGTVVGVGGTTLIADPGTKRGWRERAWSLGGGGCSAIEPKPAWQRDALCPTTSSAVDVSADADPSSGAAVYFAQGMGGGDPGGWYVGGGTSLASPLVAGMIAVRGGTATAASYWTGATHIFDVSGGTNGWCEPVRECTAVAGYDGATGWGSPAP